MKLHELLTTQPRQETTAYLCALKIDKIQSAKDATRSKHVELRALLSGFRGKMGIFPARNHVPAIEPANTLI